MPVSIGALAIDTVDLGQRRVPESNGGKDRAAFDIN